MQNVHCTTNIIYPCPWSKYDFSVTMDVDGHAYARPPIDGHPDIKDAPARFTEVVNVDKIFVSKIKGHPILYDHTHKDFGLVDDSQLAWESVIKEMIEDITKHTAEYPGKLES